MNQKNLEFHGHRGCRGLLPENTIVGFLKALDFGVTALEIDVVVTKDHIVLCSHEPWFSHEISFDPFGNPLAKAEEKEHSIYEMTFAEAKKYDVGLKPHNRFQQQQKIAATKPALEEVIAQCDPYAKATARSLPIYNIEIKSQPEHDHVFHPPPAKFSELVMDVIAKTGIQHRVLVQSFDPRILQHFHKNYVDIPLGLLVENRRSPIENIENLGFVPAYYNPHFTLVNDNLIAFCKSRKMKIIPWTVNDLEVMKELINKGVDGIISDFPNLFQHFINPN